MDHDAETSPNPSMRFQSILQVDVPKGRDGKHKEIVSQLLNDIAQLEEGSALKIPLADLPDSKENIRSALSRAARQNNLDLATSSDEHYLFVWKAAKKSPVNGLASNGHASDGNGSKR
jgi:TusA-related sulfurtransferase